MKSPKPELVVVCKTYNKDFKSFCHFYESFNKHNADKLKLYVSVPKVDFELFSDFVKGDVIVITDESYANKYLASDNKALIGLSVGYINQEICKLSFWENDIAHNYLFVDSDSYFIRDFFFDDFMADKQTPYSVLVMDKDLKTELDYREFSKYRDSQIRKIFELVELKDNRFLTCHGMTVLSEKVLKDFKERFMHTNKFAYKDLIEMAPYEYTWYNAWLQKSNVINILPVEPFFKTFHTRKEYSIARSMLIKEDVLAEQYLGIVLNSNWKTKTAIYEYENPKLQHRVINLLLEKIG